MVKAKKVKCCRKNNTGYNTAVGSSIFHSHKGESKLKCYRNDCTDAHYNLQLEEKIFREYASDEDFFMLWRNENAVIVGKNQVIEDEVDLVYAKDHDVQIVRRITGGGAVYHDLGNVNYTYIGKKAGEFGNFLAFAQPVIDFLQTLGVHARHLGKNDIGIGDRKISGNAQAVREEYILHHGTILFDINVSVLEKVLTPDPEKLRGKGIKSVRSRVCNISDYVNMSREEFWERICAYFQTEDIALLLGGGACYTRPVA